MTTSPSPEPVETIVEEIVSAIDLLGSVPHEDDGGLDAYRELCRKIPEHIRTGLVRIAVVGVIKSGKSTLINALTRKELVKRGAGVVTSMTTRICKGKKNRALVHLKSWDEVNLSVEQVLDMFPQERPEDRFDIRRKKDRAYLGQVYETICSQFPVTRDGIRPEALVIRNALEGFEACREMIEADEQQVCFESRAFDRHKDFTADPSRAFYVRDVCLEVFGRAIPPGVEIADCQGADSTDPAQLAQILAYIESANLIVYCVSSRTGLRQSDMAFLKQIKRLGLMENILFVNNCDLAEHEDLADLTRIEEKIRQELVLLTPDPKLFSFSALFILFEALGTRLSKRNSRRLSLWQEDGDMVQFSTENYKCFNERFTRLLEDRQFDLLYANHLERLRIVARALENKAGIVKGLLADDLAEQDRARDQMKDVEENARRLRVIVDNSVQGAVTGLNREIETNLKNAFLKDTININREVSGFIRGAGIDVDQYRSGVKETGFKQILYLMFQDFKRQLDYFVLNQIIPELKALVDTQERRIEAYFQALLDSYQVDIFAVDSLEPGVASGLLDPAALKAVDIAAVKKILGLKLPEQVFSTRYTTRMRANALTDFGFHSLKLFISALVDKHVRFSFSPGLNKAAAKIKKESLLMIRGQIKAYHLSLRREYFTPLIQAVTRDFKDKIIQRFTLYESLNKDMEKLFELKADERALHRKKITEAEDKIRLARQSIDAFSLGTPPRRTR